MPEFIVSTGCEITNVELLPPLGGEEQNIKFEGVGWVEFGCNGSKGIKNAYSEKRISIPIATVKKKPIETKV